MFVCYNRTTRLARIVGVVLLGTLGAYPIAAAEPSPDDNVVTVVNELYRPANPEDTMSRLSYAIMTASAEEHKADPSKPRIQVLPWTSLSMAGPVGRAPRLMALAGNVAADILFTLWHETRTNIEEGYLMPLNEFIGEDTNGNGWIDDAEAIWPYWKNIHPYAKLVATVDGKVYALPMPRPPYQSLIVRADLFRAAGLDPTQPPRDWDEFFTMCQKLTDPGATIAGARFQRGQRAIFLTQSAWQWIAWLWCAGGQTLTQYRVDPETGREYAFPELEIEFSTVDPETGKTVNLRRQPSRWQATFAGEAGVQTCAFFHKLMWQRWIRLPDGEPLNLTNEEAEQGWALNPGTGQRVSFDPNAVITGVARPSRREDQKIAEMFQRGEVAIYQGSVTELKELNVPAENLSFFPIPGRTANDQPRAMFFFHLVGLNHSLAQPEEAARRRAAWRILSTYCGTEGNMESIREDVAKGYARFARPQELQEAGLDEYLQQIPKHWRTAYATIDRSAGAEPFMGFWYPVDVKLGTEVLDFILAYEDFDYAATLKNMQTAANTGMMFERSEEELQKYRPLARILFAVAVGLLGVMGVKMVRGFSQTAKERKQTGSTGNVYHPGLPWLMMSPALISILLWNYYPLTRGSLMAFQDYHVLAESPFVGLDTFINVFLDPEFWTSLRQTLKYVVIALGLTFFGPIILALLLHEVPRGKTFFRTLFFLPQVCSGIVVMMIWMLLYNPTEYGLLNQLIEHVDRLLLSVGLDVTLGKQDWLGDPRWAMIAVVIPSMWSQMGMASLVYLAALKSVDEGSYEAAQIDGAGIFKNITQITIPFLKPLIIINFVSAFIGTFQNMGNILIMTGGGPAQETMVLALRIWMEAYAYLRYSRAVAMAWVLGLLLIAFTVYQLRILKKVEFRRAADN